MCDTRRLSPRELEAIRVGLRLLVDARFCDRQAAQIVEDVDHVLGDGRILELVQVLRSATALLVDVAPRIARSAHNWSRDPIPAPE